MVRSNIAFLITYTKVNLYHYTETCVPRGMRPDPEQQAPLPSRNIMAINMSKKNQKRSVFPHNL
jgi:hypothetical protein